MYVRMCVVRVLLVDYVGYVGLAVPCGAMLSCHAVPFVHAMAIVPCRTMQRQLCCSVPYHGMAIVLCRTMAWQLCRAMAWRGAVCHAVVWRAMPCLALP